VQSDKVRNRNGGGTVSIPEAVKPWHLKGGLCDTLQEEKIDVSFRKRMVKDIQRCQCTRPKSRRSLTYGSVKCGKKWRANAESGEDIDLPSKKRTMGAPADTGRSNHSPRKNTPQGEPGQSSGRLGACHIRPKHR